jgi:hypothetical protein
MPKMQEAAVRLLRRRASLRSQSGRQSDKHEGCLNFVCPVWRVVAFVVVMVTFGGAVWHRR